MFERDCDELNSWINEKFKIAKSEEYLDPSNLQAKQEKHANFEAELTTHQPVIKSLCATGTTLVQEDHFAKEKIDHRIKTIMTQWDRLVDATEQKSARLKEATEGQSFNRNLEDIDIWLSECEAQLANEDLGKDLTSVQNLQKKLKDLEGIIVVKNKLKAQFIYFYVYFFLVFKLTYLLEKKESKQFSNQRNNFNSQVILIQLT